MIKETFGQRFARLRKAKGLTQEAVASKLNISGQAVSKWENDLSAPDISILPDLADILGISVDALLGREKDDVVKIATPQTVPSVTPVASSSKAEEAQTPEEDPKGSAKDSSGEAKESEEEAKPKVDKPAVDLKDLTFHVKVLSHEGDIVKMNLPLSIVEAMATHEKDGSLRIEGNGAMGSLNNIDLRQVIDLAKQGVLGNIVNVMSSDGDIVKVYISGPEDGNDDSYELFANRHKHHNKNSFSFNTGDLSNLGARISKEVQSEIGNAFGRKDDEDDDVDEDDEDDIDDQIDEIQDDIDSVKDDISDLNDDLSDEDNDDVADTETKIAAKTDDLAKLSVKLKAAKEKKAKISSNDPAIKADQAQISTLSKEISSLTDQMASGTGDIDTLSAQIKEKAQKIKDLKAHIQSLKRGADNEDKDKSE